jgi:hypothetical protein
MVKMFIIATGIRGNSNSHPHTTIAWSARQYLTSVMIQVISEKFIARGKIVARKSYKAKLRRRDLQCHGAE